MKQCRECRGWFLAEYLCVAGLYPHHECYCKVCWLTVIVNRYSLDQNQPWVYGKSEAIPAFRAEEV